MADNLETSIFSNQSDGGRALAVAGENKCFSSNIKQIFSTLK